MLNLRSCRRCSSCSQGRRVLCVLFVYSAVSGWEVWYGMCHEQPVSLVTMRMRTFTAISRTGTALSNVIAVCFVRNSDLCWILYQCTFSIMSIFVIHKQTNKQKLYDHELKFEEQISFFPHMTFEKLFMPFISSGCFPVQKRRIILPRFYLRFICFQFLLGFSIRFYWLFLISKWSSSLFQCRTASYTYCL